MTFLCLLEKKNILFLVKKLWKTSYNSNNFQHIGRILRTSVYNLVLQIPLKFQVDRIKIVPVIQLAKLKKAVLRKTCLKV